MTTTFYTGNTKYGSGSLKINNTDGGNNSAFGVAALSISTEKWNTAVGAYSGLATTTGISNTSVGTNTLLQNISGNYNTALGTAALCLNTEGSGNTAVGSNSIEYNLTGVNNTMIGTETGKSIVTGSNNICLGYKAGTSSGSIDYSNCILIGNNVYPTGSNQAIIGDGFQASMDLRCSQNPTMSGYTIPASTDASNKIATCEWVQGAISSGSSLLVTNNTWLGTNDFDNIVSVNTASLSLGTLSSFSIKDTTTNLSIQFNPQTAANQWNPITQTNDSLIFGYASGTPDISNLTLTTHSSTSSGVRITATTAMIGAGGNGSTPTSSILFSGTNADITGTLSIGNNVFLNSSSIFDRQISSSYYNFYSTGTTSLVNCGVMYGDDGLVVFQSFVSGSTGQPGKFIFYSRDIFSVNVNALEINSTSITTPYIINAPSTLIGTSTLNMTGQSNINSYMLADTNFYTNNATSGTIKFFTNDPLNMPKNPLSLSSTGIKIVDGSLTFPDLSVQTTAYTGSFWIGSGSNIYYNLGNVGIGTNTPTKILEVFGGDALINQLTIGTGNHISTGNTALGFHALFSDNSGTNNTAVGKNALFSNNSGNSNIAIGFEPLISNVTGAGNIAIGTSAMHNNIAGNNNTCVGYNTLYSNIGSNNTAVGYISGSGSTTGTGNTFLGSTTAIPFGSVVDNSTAIGYGAIVSLSNQIYLGNTSITDLNCQVALAVISDARDKTNFVPLDAGLNFINELNPIRFEWNQRGGGLEGRKDVGFTAQELLSVQKKTKISIPNLVDESNPEKYHVMYTQLIPILVKSVQEMSSTISRLESEINTLKNL